MKLQMTYFAILREQRGCSGETLESQAATAGQLYDELRAQYRFTLPPERVRVAIDGEFASWDAPLRENQRITFIPPVAGG
jgi:molybdopterin converting factor small subunit